MINHLASPGIPEGWDDWLKTVSCAGFCQTSSWAEMRQFAAGATPYVVEVAAGGVRKVAGLFLYEKPIASVSGWVLRLLGEGRLGCVDGPVITEGCEDEFLRQWLQAVDELGCALGVSEISIAPPSGIGCYANPAAVFDKANWSTHLWETVLVDLTSEEAALFASFDHAARKGVNKCERFGLTVEVCASWDDYRNKFVSSFHDSFGHEGLKKRTHKLDRDIWDASVRSGCYRYYVARLPDGPVEATLGVCLFNGVATEVMSGRTVAGVQSKLPAQDLLHWVAMREAKRVGAVTFDLAGFNPAPQTLKEEGIRRFKLKWGGRVVGSPGYIRTYSNLAACAIGAVRSLKSSVGIGTSLPTKRLDAE